MLELPINKIIQGDALAVLKTFPDESINCVMTSPPYFNQRDYGIKGQLGLEKTPEEYIFKLCDIFSEVKRVLRKDGTCWINIADCYGGFQGKNSGYPDRKQERADTAKSLLCVPEMFLLEMVKRGWLIRNKIIWWKPNVMPSSANDRFTIDYEMLYFFVKSKNYFFEKQLEPIAESSFKDKRKDKGLVPNKSGKSMDIKLIQSKTKEQKLTKQDLVGNPTYTGFNKRYQKKYGMLGTSINSQGRNMRTVWRITTKSNREQHYAMYPEKLCIVPIKSGCPENGIVLDPFMGGGTTALVSLKLNRKFIGIELNEKYIEISKKRLLPYLEQRKLT